MTTLSFTKKDGAYPYWEALTQVSADFNLHVETKKPGALTLEVTTVSTGKYAQVDYDTPQTVFDRDYDGIVYPKKIRVRTWSEPNVGYVTEAE